MDFCLWIAQVIAVNINSIQSNKYPWFYTHTVLHGCSFFACPSTRSVSAKVSYSNSLLIFQTLNSGLRSGLLPKDKKFLYLAAW